MNDQTEPKDPESTATSVPAENSELNQNEPSENNKNYENIEENMEKIKVNDLQTEMLANLVNTNRRLEQFNLRTKVLMSNEGINI